MKTSASLPQIAAQAELFESITGVPCVAMDRAGGLVGMESARDYPCALCRSVSGDDTERPDGLRHMKWVEEALRFGGSSIFLCENAFTHWTSPVVEEGRLVGALVAGPVLTIDEEDFFEQNLLPRIERQASAEARETLRSLYERVPRVEPARVTRYAQLLRELAIAASSVRDPFDESRETLENQSRINEYLQDLKLSSTSARFAAEDPALPAYPLEKEGLLLDQIRRGEVATAQKTLNELLGAVFFESGSMDVVRARAQELVVLLSRAVLTEGADAEEVFGLNYTFVDAIGNQEDVNGIAYWMARIVRRFADLVLYMPHKGHSRSLRRVVSHLRSNIDRQVSVGEAAGIAGLSESHFSRVFREEMGETFVAYARRVRCEAAAQMLRQTDLPVQEVAARCGYEDHSYFSRVFKKTTGRSPTQVREGAPI